MATTNYNLSFVEVLAKDLNYIKFSILLIIILSTVFLNLFIIFAVCLNKSMRNFVNYQFTSIALSDLIVGSIAMPSLLVSTLYGYWPFSRSLCIIWTVCDLFGCNVSCLSLVMISSYRLKCIKKPFIRKSKHETKIQFILILIVWLVPFISWLTSIISSENSQIISNQCNFIYKFYYVVTADILAYLVPAVTLIVIQISIYFALKKQENKILPKIIPQYNHIIVTAFRFSTNIDTDEIEKLPVRSKTKSIKSGQNEKAFKSLLLVSISFLVLWLPFITTWPIQSFCNCVVKWFYDAIFWMQYSHSLINPIILINGNIPFRDLLFSYLSSIFKFKIVKKCGC
jgi:hypothetical protein